MMMMMILHEKRRLHYKFCFLLLSKYFGALSFGVSLWIKKSSFLLTVSLETEKLDVVKNILCISDDDNKNNDNF